MSLNVQAGELTQRVDIHEPLDTPGRAGSTVRDWRRLASVYARVRPLTGGERVASDRIEAAGGYHVIVRSRPDINETQSLVWRGRRHNIRWVKQRDPRSLYLEIETDVGVAI